MLNSYNIKYELKSPYSKNGTEHGHCFRLWNHAGQLHHWNMLPLCGCQVNILFTLATQRGSHKALHGRDWYLKGWIKFIDNGPLSAIMWSCITYIECVLLEFIDLQVFGSGINYIYKLYIYKFLFRSNQHNLTN